MIRLGRPLTDGRTSPIYARNMPQRVLYPTYLIDIIDIISKMRLSLSPVMVSLRSLILCSAGSANCARFHLMYTPSNVARLDSV